MRTDKQVKILESDIAKLVEFALKNGISENKIVNLAERAYVEFDKKKKSNFKIPFYISIAVFVLLTAIIFSFNAPRDFCFALVRISLIQLLPWWDWTELSNSCLVSKPVLEDAQDDSIDCGECSEGIRMDVGVDARLAEETLFVYRTPFISQGAASSWKASELFDVEFLAELFYSNKFLQTSSPTGIQFSVNDEYIDNLDNIHSLLNTLKVDSHVKHSKWFAYWENFNHTANRVLRKFYRKPPFIGPSIEVAPFHSLILSSNHDHSIFIKAGLDTPVNWMAQLRGSSKIQLQNAGCSAACADLYALLQPGDIAVWPSETWDLSHKAQKSNSPLSVVAIFGGYLD